MYDDEKVRTITVEVVLETNDPDFGEMEAEDEVRAILEAEFDLAVVSSVKVKFPKKPAKKAKRRR